MEIVWHLSGFLTGAVEYPLKDIHNGPTGGCGSTQTWMNAESTSSALLTTHGFACSWPSDKMPSMTVSHKAGRNCLLFKNTQTSNECLWEVMFS